DCNIAVKNHSRVRLSSQETEHEHWNGSPNPADSTSACTGEAAKSHAGSDLGASSGHRRHCGGGRILSTALSTGSDVAGGPGDVRGIQGTHLGGIPGGSPERETAGGAQSRIPLRLGRHGPDGFRHTPPCSSAADGAG